MKKSIVILSILYLCIFSQLDGQISMNSSGNVSIGGTPGTSRLGVSGNLSVSGNTSSASSTTGLIQFSNFITTSGYGNIKTVWESYGITLRPLSNNSCKLGNGSYFWNDAYVNHLYYRSIDSVSKSNNIRHLEGSLDKILQLNGIQYDLELNEIISEDLRLIINDPEYIKKITEENSNLIGFVPEQVKELFPNIVRQDDSLKTYSIEYLRFIPILTEAIKEQQVLINSLNSKIESLDSELFSLKNSTSAPAGLSEGYGSSNSRLYQNSPNPFTDNTVIDFFIESNFQNAAIHIYDLQGLQLSVYTLTSPGRGTITISAYDLKPGIYLYALIIDDVEIGTKKMILTD